MAIIEEQWNNKLKLIPDSSYVRINSLWGDKKERIGYLIRPHGEALLISHHPNGCVPFTDEDWEEEELEEIYEIINELNLPISLMFCYGIYIEEGGEEIEIISPDSKCRYDVDGGLIKEAKNDRT